MSDKIQSIYEFILASIGKDGKIPRTCDKLPDDASFFRGFSFGFVGGAFEGIMLQSLRNKAGVGTKLIEAGLWSKVIRNRNMALNALESWGIQHYSPLIITRLKALKKCEPDKTVKRKVVALLKNIRG